jgi:hypothetical protein
MQTFMTHDNYVDTAKALDNKRLGKQRVEAYQILKALRGDYNVLANNALRHIKSSKHYAVTTTIQVRGSITLLLSCGLATNTTLRCMA